MSSNCKGYISSVSDQNGISLLYIMLEIHHSGREPSIFNLGCHTFHTIDLRGVMGGQNLTSAF